MENVLFEWPLFFNSCYLGQFAIWDGANDWPKTVKDYE